MYWSRWLFRTYKRLPDSVQRVTRKAYETYISGSSLVPNYKRDFVGRFFDTEEEFYSYVQEFEESGVMDRVESARTEHRRRTGHGRFAAINQFTYPRLYALVRKLTPKTIVETGVCNGVSTYIILKALDTNEVGHLYSVDYPDTDRLPEGEEPGWMIPDGLRGRWSLTKGKSQEELPGVVDDIGSIGMFVHDTNAAILSEELAIVWPNLKLDGVVIADDVHQSEDISAITRYRDVDYGHVAPNVGYLIKRG